MSLPNESVNIWGGTGTPQTGQTTVSAVKGANGAIQRVIPSDDNENNLFGTTVGLSVGTSGSPQSITATYTSATINTAYALEMALDFTLWTLSGFTSVQVQVQRLGQDGTYYTVWASPPQTAALQTVSESFGSGMNIHCSLAGTMRVLVVPTGTGTAGFSLSATLKR